MVLKKCNYVVLGNITFYPKVTNLKAPKGNVYISRSKDYRYREQTGGYQRLSCGGGQMGKDGQRVQTSSYRIYKSWGCNVAKNSREK